MNTQVTITTEESSRKYLVEKLDWVLDLLDKEHHHCWTHSQRNMYQAVIRHEMEIIRDEIRHARQPKNENENPQSSDNMPF